jgi:hypothetical protein
LYLPACLTENSPLQSQCRNLAQRLTWTMRRLFMLQLITVLVLSFGGGGGYYGYSRWGAGAA